MALNRSHVENGLTLNSLSVPTSQLQAVTFSTIIGTGRSQNGSSRARDEMVVDGQDSGGDMEDARVNTREEWKPKTYNHLTGSGESEEVLLIMGRV